MAYAVVSRELKCRSIEILVSDETHFCAWYGASKSSDFVVSVLSNIAWKGKGKRNVVAYRYCEKKTTVMRVKSCKKCASG